MPLAKGLDIHRNGKELQGRIGHQFAERFLIDEVTPASEHLPKYQAGNYKVNEREKRKFRCSRKEISGEESADHRAINGEAAFVDRKDIR